MTGQVGRKRECTGCACTYFDFNQVDVTCPRCGKPPPPQIGPPRRRTVRPALALPGGFLDRVIDDGCDLLGEDSLESFGPRAAGTAIPPIAVAIKDG